MIKNKDKGKNKSRDKKVIRNLSQKQNFLYTLMLQEKNYKKKQLGTLI
jgi:hypothetical protein